MQISSTDLLALCFRHIIEGLGVNIAVLLVDDQVATLYNRMQMLDFCIVIILLVEVHVVYLLQGILSYILIENIPFVLFIA